MPGIATDCFCSVVSPSDRLSHACALHTLDGMKCQLRELDQTGAFVSTKSGYFGAETLQ